MMCSLTLEKGAETRRWRQRSETNKVFMTPAIKGAIYLKAELVM